MPIVFYYARLLQDLNICTCIPYLRTFQTIPAEGQDIISGSQGCWNIHLILESPIIGGRQIFGNVHFSPFWPRWSCPNRGRFQFHWNPTPLEILWLGDPWLPIKPRSFLIYPTLSDCLVYKWMDDGYWMNHTMPGESSTSSVLPKSGTTTTQPHSHGGVRICWSLK